MPSTKFPRYRNKTDLCNDLADLGWDYTAGRMSRSGMQIYDMIMTRLGVLEEGDLIDRFDLRQLDKAVASFKQSIQLGDHNAQDVEYI